MVSVSFSVQFAVIPDLQSLMDLVVVVFVAVQAVMAMHCHPPKCRDAVVCDPIMWTVPDGDYRNIQSLAQCNGPGVESHRHHWSLGRGESLVLESCGVDRDSLNGD